jgi:hypothetical protein
MSRSDNDIQHRAADAGRRPPPGAAWLLPKVTFGLGTAVLAGVVVVSVPASPALLTRADAPAVTAVRAVVPAGVGHQVITTVGLGAAINAVAVSVARETTCCG